MCLGYVGEGDVVVPDAPETSQYLSERCHDQIFCAMAERITKLTLSIMNSSIGMSSEASVGYAQCPVLLKRIVSKRRRHN